MPLSRKSKKVRVVRPTSNQYVFRPNWLHPPFNNRECARRRRRR